MTHGRQLLSSSGTGYLAEVASYVTNYNGSVYIFWKSKFLWNLDCKTRMCVSFNLQHSLTCKSEKIVTQEGQKMEKEGWSGKWTQVRTIHSVLQCLSTQYYYVDLSFYFQLFCNYLPHSHHWKIKLYVRILFPMDVLISFCFQYPCITLTTP